MSRKGWILFGALCLIWGIPYLLIRVAVRDYSPPTLVFLRTAPAALLLLPLAARKGHLRTLLPRWRWVLAFAVVELAVPWLLIGRAEQHITSSMTGLLIATVPLMGAVLYGFVPGMERLDGRRLVGLIVGFAGVAALVGIDVEQTDLLAAGEVIVVALCYAIGPLVISRRLADLPGLGVTAAAITIVAIGYAPVALTHLPQSASVAAIVSVAGLALICTALAFVVFFELIIEVGPARATVITYINPLVAVLLGVVVLSEPFTRASPPVSPSSWSAPCSLPADLPCRRSRHRWRATRRPTTPVHREPRGVGVVQALAERPPAQVSCAVPGSRRLRRPAPGRRRQMHVLAILAHPRRDSFSGAIFDGLCAGLTAAGHAVEVGIFTGRASTRSCVPRTTRSSSRAQPPDVLAEQERIERADALAFVFPVWWWSLPAMLKGWIDRVFSSGWAYDFTPGHSRGLLRDRPTLLLCVAGSKESTYRKYGYDAAMRTQIDIGILGYCGTRE